MCKFSYAELSCIVIFYDVCTSSIITFTRFHLFLLAAEQWLLRRYTSMCQSWNLERSRMVSDCIFSGHKDATKCSITETADSQKLYDVPFDI